ncbi:MAG: methylated-DNA--[protein]-cysteine S-methyltransferase [Oscillospiraceae bacterium]
MDYAILRTPIGYVKIIEDLGYITQLSYVGKQAEEVLPSSNVLKMAQKQLNDYFDGHLKVFSLPLRLDVPQYRKQVLRELMKVPFGSTITYKELAQRTGNPNAARAVGSAMSSNPIAIIVPCHRVLPSDGKIGNYSAGGSANKEWLLCHEKQNL